MSPDTWEIPLMVVVLSITRLEPMEVSKEDGKDDVPEKRREKPRSGTGGKVISSKRTLDEFPEHIDRFRPPPKCLPAKDSTRSFANTSSEKGEQKRSAPADEGVKKSDHNNNRLILRPRKTFRPAADIDQILMEMDKDNGVISENDFDHADAYLFPGCKKRAAAAKKNAKKVSSIKSEVACSKNKSTKVANKNSKELVTRGKPKVKKPSSELDLYPAVVTSHFHFKNPKFLCYLISAYQLLFSNKSFCTRLLELEVKYKEDENHRFYQNFLNQMKPLALWSVDRSNEFFSQNTLDAIMKYSATLAEKRWGLSQMDQHDPSELILKLLDFMAVNFTNNIRDLFEIQIKASSVGCNDCNRTISREGDSHLIYNLALSSEEKTSVQQLVTSSLEEQIELNCSCSKKHELSSTSTILKLPEILIVHLLRYKTEGDPGTVTKIDVPVIVTQDLSIKFSNNTSSGDQQDSVGNRNYINYKLTGIVNHLGTSINSGHYTAYVLDEAEERWIFCNDNEVELITELQVISDKVVQKTCHLLSYKRVTNIP